MTSRKWSHLLTGTALALFVAGTALADEKTAMPAAETAQSSGARSAVADESVAAPTATAPAGSAGSLADPAPAAALAGPPAIPVAPTASDIAAGLANAIAMPSEPPRIDAPTAFSAPAVDTLKTGTLVPAIPAAAAPAPGAAPATAAAPAAAPTVATADLAAALQVALTELSDRRGTADERKLRAAVAAFYETRGHAPLFVDGNGPSARAARAADRFGRAAEDGLDPAAYAVPAAKAGATAAELAALEIDYALAALRYASHARSGRFEPTRLSELVTAKPPQIDPAAVLADLAGAADVSAALEAYNPPHEGYRRLKAKLAALGGYQPPPAPVPVVQVPAGPTLKPGQKDRRVAALRERLGVAATATDAGDVYDDGLVEAVKAFQQKAGIKATGLIGPATVTALNDPEAAPDGRGPEPKAVDLVANMERWRWLPLDLGSMHVFVNIPDFHLVISRDGAAIHRTRVIVGKVQNQTPVFSETMTHIIVNPYWNVPVSILKKEMLGRIQETGGAYLDRGNYEVVVGRRVVASNEVDWSTVNPASVTVRQRPGGGNALGNIKFMFPNQHSVYLHDTSSRGLFAQNYRALSHGCVRVNEPFAFADALLSEEPGDLDGKKLKGMIGGGEKYLWLKRKLEVHLAYFTAFVDDDGTLQSRPDIYGHNARTKKLLGL